ncbi:MAG: epoxide hydrolase 1 [Burkholderiales bacterium]|nr:epoxide hydrolase 1 [Burkholderiales bacterium]
MTSPTPFTLHVDDAVLDDLRARLARTRMAETMPGAAWSLGTDPGWLAEILDHWRTGFDWRAQEARLNAFPQFTLPVDDITLHFLHVPGVGPAPTPLLLPHGWPGSVFEFLHIVPRLTDPARFGGDARDAFTVVAPSLPGFGLSFAPGQRRFSVEQMADTFATLMTVLGYPRFAAQGGDWGAFVVSRLAHAYPDRLLGVHVNLLPVRRDPGMVQSLALDDVMFLNELKHFLAEEVGYQDIQGTKPQTLAIALNDSPAGLAAWILEKFHRWSDCDGDPRNAVPVDELLANVTLYWVTQSIGGSMWPYHARRHGRWPIPDVGGVRIPMGYAEFPKEILHPPRWLAEKMFTDIRRWTQHDRGGHFAALEQPDVLAHEIREFFRPLRG